jgi:hypothetical protein
MYGPRISAGDQIGSYELPGWPQRLMIAPRIGAGVVKRTLVIIASDDGRTYTGPESSNAGRASAECPV